MTGIFDNAMAGASQKTVASTSVRLPPPPPVQSDGLLGYQVRQSLHPGEAKYFKDNPHVAGMASESGHIVLNPNAPASVNRDAVAKNEAFRLLLRDKGVTPKFEVTEEQKASFKGTPYAKDESALKQTIAARIYSGDPSARATGAQQTEVNEILRRYLGAVVR